MKVTFTLGIGFVGARHEEVIEFDDDTTDEELDEFWTDWSHNYIDGGWSKDERV